MNIRLFGVALDPIAIYAAVVSTILAVSQLLRNRRRLQVEYVFTDGSREVIYVTIVNNGSRPVRIMDKVGFSIGYRGRRFRKPGLVIYIYPFRDAEGNVLGDMPSKLHEHDMVENFLFVDSVVADVESRILEWGIEAVESLPMVIEVTDVGGKTHTVKLSDRDRKYLMGLAMQGRGRHGPKHGAHAVIIRQKG
jgi:hypothetical protein